MKCSIILRTRPEDGHKGTFGHALIISGQWGMAGASVLAAKACLRSGVGKVTVHIPRRNNDILQVAVPEAIVQHDASELRFTEAVSTKCYDAVAIGPGIGTHPDTQAALAKQLQNHGHSRLVLDADALNILAGQLSLFSLLPQETILTPHLGEYHRLAPEGTLPQEFARDHNVVLVLKGHPTRIYMPDGTSEKCPYGNEGMATAGSGDVLTGIIVALLAQGYSQREAAILGVFLHALAGDYAQKEKGSHSLIASDIIDALPHAFAEVCKFAVRT